MISHLLIIGLLYTGFVTIIDNQNMDYDWIESCYGMECIGYEKEPEYHNDGISYWNYSFNI